MHRLPCRVVRSGMCHAPSKTSLHPWRNLFHASSALFVITMLNVVGSQLTPSREFTGMPNIDECFDVSVVHCVLSSMLFVLSCTMFSALICYAISFPGFMLCRRRKMLFNVGYAKYFVCSFPCLVPSSSFLVMQCSVLPSSSLWNIIRNKSHSSVNTFHQISYKDEQRLVISKHSSGSFIGR